MFIAFLLLLGNNSNVFANESTFRKMPEGFRIGMEIELTPEAMSSMMHLFDYSKLQNLHSDKITENFKGFNDYLLDNPEELHQFPAEIKAKLSEGLKLDKISIVAEKELIDSKGSKLSKEKSLILTNQDSQFTTSNSEKRIFIPKESLEVEKLSNSRGEVNKTLELPKRLDWKVLNDRWNSLSFQEKQLLVNWEKLSPDKKTQLLQLIPIEKFELKESVPEKTKELFKRFQWSADGNASEFRHRSDLVVSDLNAFYKDINDFLKFVSPEAKRKILNPDQNFSISAGLHFHVSDKNKNLTAIAKSLNDLLFLRRIQTGEMIELKNKGVIYGYNPNALSKGLIRIIDDHRFEWRAHPWALQEELQLIEKLISVPELEALKELKKLRKKTLTDDVALKLLKYRPELIGEFESDMSTEFIKNNSEKISFAKKINHFTLNPDIKILSDNDFIELLKNFESDLYKQASILFSRRNKINWTPVVKEITLSTYKKAKGNLATYNLERSAIYKVLEFQKENTPESLLVDILKTIIDENNTEEFKSFLKFALHYSPSKNELLLEIYKLAPTQEKVLILNSIASYYPNMNKIELWQLITNDFKMNAPAFREGFLNELRYFENIPDVILIELLNYARTKKGTNDYFEKKQFDLILKKAKNNCLLQKFQDLLTHHFQSVSDKSERLSWMPG